MDEILLLLAEKGAVSAPLNITTRELGSSLSMSQQNASVRIKKLCATGILKKSEKGIQITAKGKEELRALYLKLKSLFGGGEMFFSGKIVHGRDEGKAFISIPGYRHGIKKLLGFEPFPGTLNVELPEVQIEKRVALRERRGVILEGFHHEGETYGMAEFYRCKVNGLDGALIFPYRTHHGLRILEIISPYDLKKTLGVREGSEVKIEVALG